MLECKGIKNSIVDIDYFTLGDKHKCALIGPSGCGKTTFLRILLGLTDIDQGTIEYNGILYTKDSNIIIKPNKRKFSMVDQHSVLYPHLSVWDNITLGDTRRFKKAEMWLDILGLKSITNRPATQLSGGQQQRICVIRALVDEPRVLLLDEPFNNQDMQTKKELFREIIPIIEQQNIQVLLVTHDFNEVLNLCDYVWVMKNGRIHTSGAIEELYSNPPDKWTANFLDECIDFSSDEMLNIFGLSTNAVTTRSKYIDIQNGSNTAIVVLNTFFDGRGTNVIVRYLPNSKIFNFYSQNNNITVGDTPALSIYKYWSFL